MADRTERNGHTGNGQCPEEIPAKHISFVIQGPLLRSSREGIERCMQSIRTHFSGAEIVISTWKSEDTSGLDADHVVKNDPPPAVPDIFDRAVNINRQIVSTVAGLEIASRRFAAKVRADLAFSSNALARVADYPPDLTARRLFRRPITTVGYFFRDPAKVPFLFHPSDVAQLGLREDLLDFWNCHLFEPEDVIDTRRVRNPLLGNFVGPTRMRQVPEQLLARSWLQRHGVQTVVNHVSDTPYAMSKLSEQVLATNFFLLRNDHSGLIFPSRFYETPYGERSLYTPETLMAAGRAAEQDCYRWRYLRILFNRYVKALFLPIWWRSVIANVLTGYTPGWARRLRRWDRELRERRSGVAR